MQDYHGLGFQIGPKTEHGLSRELWSMNGCIERLVGYIVHARRSESHSAIADHVEDGGLRVMLVTGANRSRPRLAVNVNPRRTASPEVSARSGGHFNTTAL